MAAKTKVKATIRTRRAARIVIENGGKSVSAAMREAGFSDAYASNPQKLTDTKTWAALMDEYLGEESLTKAHKELMSAKRLDHMIFPLGPEENGEVGIVDDELDEDGIHLAVHERMQLSDDDIKEMLKDVNCTVRKIVHGQTARHVYFWSMDARARKDALDMAYKLRGAYAPEKTLNVNIELEPSDDIKALADKLNGV